MKGTGSAVSDAPPFSIRSLLGGEFALLGELRKLLQQLAHNLLILLPEVLPHLIIGLPT